MYYSTIFSTILASAALAHAQAFDFSTVSPPTFGFDASPATDDGSAPSAAPSNWGPTFGQDAPPAPTVTPLDNPYGITVDVSDAAATAIETPAPLTNPYGIDLSGLSSLSDDGAGAVTATASDDGDDDSSSSSSSDGGDDATETPAPTPVSALLTNAYSINVTLATVTTAPGAGVPPVMTPVTANATSATAQVGPQIPSQAAASRHTGLAMGAMVAGVFGMLVV